MADGKAFVRELFDRVAAKDLDGVAAMFAEDAVFVDSWGPTRIEGRAAIRDLVAEMWVGLPDFRVERIDSIVAEGNTVMAEVELAGTHGGEYLGHPATGKTVRWASAVLYELDEAGEQILREAYYYDSAGLLAQLAGQEG